MRADLTTCECAARCSYYNGRGRGSRQAWKGLPHLEGGIKFNLAHAVPGTQAHIVFCQLEALLGALHLTAHGTDPGTSTRTAGTRHRQGIQAHPPQARQ